MINKTCFYCKKTFIVHNYRKNSAIFCSQKCHGFSKRKPLTFNCPICNKKHNPKDRRNIYCSNKCSGLSKRKRIKINCIVCNKVIEIIFSQKNRKKYCSKKCQHDHYKKRFKGKNNPFYKKTHSKKTRQIISKSNKGRKKSVFEINRKIIITKKGYAYIYQPLHPFCTSQGYVRRSRLVLEGKIKRFLKPTEIPHHINGCTLDDRKENLLLFKNQSEHMKYHCLLKSIQVK